MSLIRKLSKSELRVTKELTRGYSEKEIADRLCVAYKTIRTHTYNIRKKLKARCAVDVARQFLLSLEEPKKFIIAIGFLSIQGFTVYANPDIDLRRARRSSTRIVRVSRKNQ